MAAYHLAEGNWGQASLSIAGVVPFVGTVKKLKYLEKLKYVRAALGVAEHEDDLADGVKQLNKYFSEDDLARMLSKDAIDEGVLDQMLRMSDEELAALKATNKYPTRYHIVSTAEVAKLRDEFNSRSFQKKILQEYSNSSESIIQRMTQSDRDLLVKGRLPEGYVLHHKLPSYG